MELAKYRRQQHLSARRYLGNATSDTSIDLAVRLIGKYFSMPMVQVNVLTADEQITLAAVGGPLGRQPREDSLCHRVVSDGQAKLLADINPIPAASAQYKAYLGVPLTGREGLTIGALCLLDTVPRPFTDQDVQDLHSAALVVQDQLELSRRLGSVSYGSTDDAAELTTAVQSGHILPFYQPIVDLATGDIAGVEALARWRRPVGGILGPAEFIPLAEDSNIILDLDVSILSQAASQLRRWRVERPDLRLSVNLSARHFDHPECLRRLQQTVEAAGIDPSIVSFELTETAALSTGPAGEKFLDGLRRAGFHVVLDDFGSGFASIDQVLRLPIDGVKLDRTMTAAMGSRRGDAVVRHLVALAADLDLSIVIEGIEDARQAEQARSAGAAFGQGYVWAPPLSADDMTIRLGAGNAVDATHSRRQRGSNCA